MSNLINTVSSTSFNSNVPEIKHPSWASLLPELGRLICLKLSFKDCINLSSVNHHWRDKVFKEKKIRSQMLDARSILLLWQILIERGELELIEKFRLHWIITAGSCEKIFEKAKQFSLWFKENEKSLEGLTISQEGKTEIFLTKEMKLSEIDHGKIIFIPPELLNICNIKPVNIEEINFKPKSPLEKSLEYMTPEERAEFLECIKDLNICIPIKDSDES